MGTELNLMGTESALINPFVQIAKNTRRHAPDVALAERHRVILALDAFPVAAVRA